MRRRMSWRAAAAMSLVPSLRMIACETLRAGSATVQANSTNEDRAKIFSRNGVTIATVADGHGSHFVSQFVVDRLPDEIFRRVSTSRSSHSTASIVSAFMHVDNLLKDLFMSEGERSEWHSGSCAIAAIITDHQVTVANCGDSRALLVDADRKSFQWVSEAHTADSESEQIRLRSLHPDELDVVHCRQKIVELNPQGQIDSVRWAACYVKSRLQPTRSFGDFYLKDARAVDLCPDLVPGGPFTPPYIEAAPSIEQFERSPGSILILASDGLWDYVSPEDVLEVLRDETVRSCGGDDIASVLIQKALEIAADATNGELSLQELKDMSPGHDKRNIHDDITTVVVVL